MEPQLLHTVDDGIATVVIHHPAKRNAMTTQMWRALPPLLDKLAADPSVRVLVLTGAGATFCAGAEISSLSEPALAAVDGAAAQRQTATQPAAEERAATPQQFVVAAQDALAAFPQPTLAAVRGHCVGGGCLLAVACDLRFADENTRFGVTPAKLGVAYPPSATRRLVGLVGPATAKYLLFSGELIDSAHALRTGLVDEVLPSAGLAGRVTEFARILASRSQLTQAAAKEFIDGPEGTLAQTLEVPPASEGPGEYSPREDRAAYWAEEARRSGETAEGVAAFLERRAPQFRWPVIP